MKRILMGIFSLALIMAMPLMPAPAAAQAGQATAVFAGGCFWCLESDMDKVKGVLSTTSGYTGGTVANPTYEQVSAGKTGHTEAVKVVYDPSVVSYKELLHVFWRNIDPLTANAQFCDHGTQYRAAIFYGNDEEKRAAEASKAELAGRFPQPIVTQVAPASTFYPAEDYHQDYYKKNPVKYKFYRTTCGRDRRLQEVWGKEAGAHGS
jgi:peptide-methionine (S)-S-oxide reductase